MRAAHLVLVALSSACSSQGASAPPSADGDLTGGFDAKSPAMNAIGTIGFAQGSLYTFFCSAALIGPHTVLTAKHCAIDSSPVQGDAGAAPSDDHRRYFMDEGTVVFGIGPNASAPQRTVPVTTVVASPIDTGGFVGLGSDVAVYTLAEDVKDVIPLKVATGAPDPSLVGQTLVAVGYGYQDQTRTLLGNRRAGSLTVRAVTGKALEAVFGSSQAFFNELAKQEGQAFVDAHRADYQALYDTPLVDQYELYAGAQEGNAQVCNGDSGGPLIQKLPDGSRVIVGVASGVMVTDRLPCAMGAAYGTFGPKVQEMITAALEDPCGSVTVAGRCEDNVAIRCTAPNEGARRVVRLDCGTLAQKCGLDAHANAACVEPAQVVNAGGTDAGGAGAPDAGH